MKPNVLHIGLAVVLLFAAAPNARSQSTFVNLDFESANIIPDPASPYYPNAVSISNGLPGWSAYGGTFGPGQDIIYDTLSLGAAAISIHDANGLIPIVQGSYTLYVQASYPGGAIVPAIGQVGTVPTTARSVMFYGGGYTVTFAGQPIPVTAVGSGPN